MRGQAGFFDIDERLKDLSAKGDDLERLKAWSTSRCSARRFGRRCRVRTAAREGVRHSTTC